MKEQLEKIRILQHEERLAKAERLCRKLMADYGAIPEICALSGAILICREKREEGENLLFKAEEKAESLDATGLADLGGGFLLSNHHQKAKFFLDKAFSMTPRHSLVNAYLGMFYMHTGDFSNAKTRLETAISISPDITSFRYNLARTLVRLNSHERALKELETASSFQKKTPVFVIETKIEALIALNRFQEAEEESASLNRFGYGESDRLRLLGRFSAARNRHDDAEACFRRGLETDPENINLLNEFSELSELRGRFMEAVRAIRKALMTEEDNPHLWSRLSSLFLKIKQLNPARDAAEKANELSKNKTPAEKAFALSSLACVESEESSYEKAESLFKSALENYADSIPALHGLGRMLLLLGRIDEAVDLFKRLAKIAPAFGHSSLAAARVFPDDPEILKAIERAARLPTLAGSIKPELMFTLALSWEKLGEYGKAFAFLKEGNEGARRHIHYDSDKNRRHIIEIITCFNQDFFLKRDHFGIKTDLPVFVLGMPRSGTTLVEQMLGSHPRVHPAGELGLMPYHAQALAMWERHIGSGRDYPECIDELTEAHVGKIAEHHLSQLRDFDPTALRVVDKLPHNFLNIGLIHLLFPGAPVIHCVRDVRDVALSNYFNDFAAKFWGLGYAYDLADIGMHIADYQHLIQHWHKVLPGRILDIRYEELIEQPEHVAKKMLDHIGLEWDPHVLDFQKLARPVKTASVWQVRQPVYQTSRGKWLNYKDELETFSRAYTEEFQKLEDEEIPDTVNKNRGLFAEALKQHQEGNLDAAESMYRKILEETIDHSGARYMLGCVTCRKGDYKKALELINSTRSRYKYLPAFHFNAGSCLLLDGQLDAAETAFKKAIQLKPDYIEAYKKLSFVYLKQNDLEKYENTLKKMHGAGPEITQENSNKTDDIQH